MTVTKVNMVPEIWRIFYDRIKASVLTTTITGPKVVNVKTYDSNFSDRPFDDNTYYPTIVINTPSVPTQRFTSGKDKVDGNILIEIYTFQSESADDFIAQTQDTIETYRAILANNGIRNITFGELQSDMVVRGSIKVHIRRLPINFRYYYNRTISY
jgi:hypothetical protein